MSLHPSLSTLAPANVANVSVSQTWLKTYGYLLPHAIRTSDLWQETVLRGAVASMQRFYGIPVTGSLDETTVE